MDDEEDDFRAGINIDPKTDNLEPDPQFPEDELFDEGGMESGIHIDPKT